MKGSVSFLLALSLATSATLAQTDVPAARVPDDVLNALGLGDLKGAKDNNEESTAEAMNEDALATAESPQSPPVLIATNETRPPAPELPDDARNEVLPVDVVTPSLANRATDTVLSGMTVLQLLAAQQDLLAFIGTQWDLWAMIAETTGVTDVEALQSAMEQTAADRNAAHARALKSLNESARRFEILREANFTAQRDVKAKREAAAAAIHDADAKRREARLAEQFAEERQQEVDDAQREAERLTASLTAAEDELRRADTAAKLAAEALSRIQTDASVSAD